MIDIDHFKVLNDTYGHVAGDEVLKQIAQLLKRESRGSDMAVRYGGEEFTLLMSHTAIEQGKVKAESIRAAIEQLVISEINNSTVTVSLGVTELLPSDLDIQCMITRADEALYEAKNTGRNKVCLG